MGRFLFLLAIVLFVIIVIGNLIHIRVKRILEENNIPVKGYFLRFINSINFNKLANDTKDDRTKSRWKNLLTLDVFVQILVLILTIAFILILVNDFYRQ